ncbi:MAG: class I SAM-dependent methyltransferase [Vulcanimicrobiaceae bacterium]
MSDAPLASAQRFTGLAGDYDRYRPTYPREAIAAILDGLPVPATIADIGAGTGIATRALASAGANAVAIEPNDEMRAIAAAHGLDARPGTAAATGLPDGSVDGVTCFQAFHWFANEAALGEFARVLRDGGRLALIWNERETRADPFTREFRALEEQFGEAAMLAGMNFADASLEPLLRSAGFTGIRRLQFHNEQRLDAEGLVGRVRSTSYAPRGGPALADVERALRALHDRFADRSGHATLAYRTDVYIGERSSHRP